MDLDTVLHRAPDTRYRRVRDEGVVIRQSTAEALVLNDLGARLFELIDGRTSVTGLLDRLEAEYEVERPVLQADVMEYIAELDALGLVTAGNG
ncbi:MAG: PqqD family protein [Thermoanaerobaculia bacterium]